MSELIAPPYAPPAAGPYSPGLLTGDWIYLSGQGGFDPDAGELVSDNIADQTAQAFRKVEVLLRAAGASLGDVVSCLCISAIWHSSPSSMPATQSSSRAR